ncbi:MAG: hypothetical protein HZB53_15915 [Chloroflexi bacterium]|nr:hypothetical protein [Chloroflexota bacterium]
MKRLWWLWLCLALSACDGLADSPSALPTAFPARLAGDAATPAARLPGVMATRAPFATPLPPTPRPGAPPITHPLAGKADCISCHSARTTFAMPPSHSLRTNDMCIGCHTLDPSVLQPAPKLARHTAEGRAACLLCHLRGDNGAQGVPANHAGRLNDTCRSCHALK